MDYGIYERLQLLYSKREEIVKINEEIDRIKKESQKKISRLANIILEKNKDLMEFSVVSFPLRLGKLLDELSWLSGIDRKYIRVSLETNVNVNDDGLATESCNKVIRFRLWSEYTPSKYASDVFNYVIFSYFMFLPLNLDAIQADGKKLIEHVSFVNKDGSSYKQMVIDKDIEDVICEFNLSNIEHDNGISWYPADLFSQAVINCIQRQRDARVDKIRARIK